MSDFVINDGILEDYIGPGGDIVIPAEVRSVCDSAFWNCPNRITSITFEDFTFGALTYLEDLPETDYYIVNADNEDYVSVDGIIYSWDICDIVKVPAGLTGKYVMPSSVRGCYSFVFDDSHITEIDMSAVKDWSSSDSLEVDSVEKLTLSSTLSFLPRLSMKNLRSLVIPESVISFRNELFYCYNLECLEILSPNFKFMEGQVRKTLDYILHHVDYPLSHYPVYKKQIAVGTLIKTVQGLPVSDENVKDAVRYLKRYGKDINWKRIFSRNRACAPVICGYGLLSEEQMDDLISECSAKKETEMVALLIEAKEKVYPSSERFERLMKKVKRI